MHVMERGEARYKKKKKRKPKTCESCIIPEFETRNSEISANRLGYEDQCNACSLKRKGNKAATLTPYRIADKAYAWVPGLITEIINYQNTKSIATCMQDPRNS